MAKERFLVVFDEKDERLTGLFEKHYPKAFRLADNVRLIAEDTSVGVVSSALKIYPVDKDEDSSLGVVFALAGGIQGYAQKDLWGWLEAVKD